MAIEANYLLDTCHNMFTVSVPIQYDNLYRTPVDLTEDLQMTWRGPNCGACELKDGICRFKGDEEEIRCFNLPRRGKWISSPQKLMLIVYVRLKLSK